MNVGEVSADWQTHTCRLPSSANGSRDRSPYRVVRRSLPASNKIGIYRLPATGRYEGEVYLPDTKTKTRTRTVRITDHLCRELVVLTKGKDPDDPVFNMKYAISTMSGTGRGKRPSSNTSGSRISAASSPSTRRRRVYQSRSSRKRWATTARR